MKKARAIIFLVLLILMLNFSSLTAGALDFDAEEKYNSVFVIYAGNSLGSGFALGKDCVITNAHVVSDNKNVTVRTYGGNRYDAVVLHADEEQDIAVLWVKGADFPVLSVSAAQLKAGDDIVAIGAPKSMEYTLTKGVVSAKDRVVGKYGYIQTDAAVNEGNSGGPMLDSEGNVIGMITFKLNDSEGIGLAVPIDRILECIRGLGIELEENGNVAGSIEYMLPEEETTEPEAIIPDRSELPEETSPVFYVVCGVAFLSVVLNIILIALLLTRSGSNKKKKNAPPPPAEVIPDFEIEFLE